TDPAVPRDEPYPWVEDARRPRARTGRPQHRYHRGVPGDPRQGRRLLRRCNPAAPACQGDQERPTSRETPRVPARRRAVRGVRHQGRRADRSVLGAQRARGPRGRGRARRPDGARARRRHHRARRRRAVRAPGGAPARVRRVQEDDLALDPGDRARTPNLTRRGQASPSFGRNIARELLRTDREASLPRHRGAEARARKVSRDPRRPPRHEPRRPAPPQARAATRPPHALSDLTVRTRAEQALEPRTDARAWGKGARGDRFTGWLVGVPEGWHVFNDVPIGQLGANIDHVVVGPGGTFTVNTKNRSGKVWLAPRTLLVNGVKTDYLPKAAREAARASDLVSAALGRTVPIRAVLAIVADDWAVKGQPSDVFVGGPRSVK